LPIGGTQAEKVPPADDYPNDMVLKNRKLTVASTSMHEPYFHPFEL